ncbi:AP-4-A phosphorylase [Andreprevotia sp. IGB-42]|uniref:HIT family protein n=1 Tax=Andreprevotia sp. IGB-42 TaxID=2497473 RepID=UPI001356C0ED|nr:HIT family protein [Andreprevotia sp. IGB-42]KAF0812296.1 AP-4-A phosphorylase [Andreprevotia sp. IGB-42]
MPYCIFCDRANLDLLAENDLVFAVRDKFPVRRLHTLILPKRHVPDTFDLSPQELHALFELARQMRDGVLKEDPTVTGFNFGSNNGAAAGQKISHVHFHLIPRRPDEAAPPPANGLT